MGEGRAGEGGGRARPRRGSEPAGRSRDWQELLALLALRAASGGWQSIPLRPRRWPPTSQLPCPPPPTHLPAADAVIPDFTALHQLLVCGRLAGPDILPILELCNARSLGISKGLGALHVQACNLAQMARMLGVEVPAAIQGRLDKVRARLPRPPAFHSRQATGATCLKLGVPPEAADRPLAPCRRWRHAAL